MKQTQIQHASNSISSFLNHIKICSVLHVFNAVKVPLNFKGKIIYQLLRQHNWGLKIATYVIINLFCLNVLKAQTFVDVATNHNINETYTMIDDLTGGGLSFYDFDDDGWDDLVFLHFNDTLSVYRNNLGSFEAISIPIYDTGQAKQVLWVDYDNNGLNDLFITYLDGPLKLYKNMGGFNFIDFTVQSGLHLHFGANHSITFGDYDKDGFLDLFVGRYSYLSDDSLTSEKNLLLKNNGNGTFTDVTQITGIDVGINQTLGSVWMDYNKDSWADIHVITDRHHIDNNLFKNNGDNTFTDVAPLVGALANNTDAMTNTVGDFDNDGDLDIYITNIGVTDTCRLLVNNNNINFTESAVAYGVNNMEATWGSSWIDADNDGFLDLIVLSQIGTGNPRNYLYMNNNGTGFIDSPNNFQSNAVADSRAIAIGDINNDGRTDCAVFNSYGYNSFLWQNTGTTGNFIKLTLHGTVSNKMAVGSWIEIFADGNIYSHYTKCGENYLGQNSQHLIFGLGTSVIIDSIKIKYPSGIIDLYSNVNVNQTLHLTEGETMHNNITYNASLSFCAGDSVVLDAGIYDTYQWNNGWNERFLTIFSSGNYWVNVTNAQGLMIESDTLSVFVSNIPQISVNANNISCFNSQDGSIVLDIINQTNNYSISWNLGLNGDSIGNLAAGNYVFDYTDEYGCQVNDSITIDEPFDFNIQTQITNCTINNLGSIQIVINGGTMPYTIYFDGNISNTFIDSLNPGNYFIEIVDFNSCHEIIYFDILFVTGGEKNEDEVNFDLFPHTMNGQILNLYNPHNLTISVIKIYNTLGQEIDFFQSGNVLQFNDSYVGLIFLNVNINEKFRTYKIMKL